MEVLERLTPYVELVHLLLNTNFTYLTRKLVLLFRKNEKTFQKE